MTLKALARRVARWSGAWSGRQAVVLLYHRVAELECDPWALAVSPRHFAEHLQVLRGHTDPLSLQELARGAREGTLPRRPVALTFDDGYRDNLQHAKPLLERFHVPATVFVPTAALTSGAEFWWDELEALLLQPGSLPPEIHLSVDGRPHRWELGDAAACERGRFDRHAAWRAWEAPPGPRQALYRAVWELLHPLDEHAREPVLQQLRAATGREASRRVTHQVMSADELVRMAEDGSIEIGAHTVTHPSLAALPPDRQQWEIRHGRDRLETIIGRPVTTFAYPFGKQHDYTPATVKILRESRFTCACTNFAGAVSRATDPFQVPRLYVTDMDGDEFARLLAEWLPLRGAAAKGAR